MKILREVLEYLGAFLVAGIIAILLVSEVFALPEVRQSSMEYTLHEGERVLLNKIGVKFSEVKRGDIIVFVEEKQPGFAGSALGLTFHDIQSIFKLTEPTTRLVKRVIGVPGDVVEIKEGLVYVNGIIEEGTYLHSETYPKNGDSKWEVTEGTLFVLGDNREVSKDSRMFGLIDANKVEGTVVFRFWPLNKMGGLN